MSYWIILPAEIRSMILEIVAEDYEFKPEQPHVRAGYASVCQEWQSFWERRNFQRVILDQERIFGLKKYMSMKSTRYRQRFLEHISFHVRLDEYDCTVCQTKEDSETAIRNDDVFNRALWKLLNTLSRWTVYFTRIPCRRQKELTLELGAYSPSDSKHTYRDVHFEHDYSHQDGTDLPMCFEACRQRVNRPRLSSLNDPTHGWVDGHLNNTSLESKQRIMGTVTMDLERPRPSAPIQPQPQVLVVTSLVIRRQFHRKIAVRTVGMLLRNTFKRLRSLRHEEWYHVDLQQQSLNEIDYTTLVSRLLPSTLRELYLFEDFSKLLHPNIPNKRARPSFGRALAASSRSLEILSAAFLVDAGDFFSALWPTVPLDSNTPPWHSLRFLALTSYLLHPDTNPQKINMLLVAAGRAAVFMPKLEIMEIWNGGEGHACVFRYEKFAGKPQITWKSSWGAYHATHPIGNIQLTDYVVLCWTDMLNRGGHPPGNLKTVVEKLLPLLSKHVKTYATALRRLKLRSHVLDNISYHQILCEGYTR